MRRRSLLLVLAAAAALALPAAAWAHAALLKTSPVASRTVNVAPTEVTLRFSEPVEPRFAVVSVTDPGARQVAAGSPRRSPADADTLVVPLKHLGEGWYLVWWRVISVDGHPVRGAFTFAVGPNPGPAPQFQIPSTSETAATPRLVAARWVAFLSVMTAIGLFVLRVLIARPLVSRVAGTSLRAATIAFAVACLVGLLAIPVYALLSTAEFALRSFWSFGALFPLLRKSAFGRGWVDLELIFALFAFAAAVAIRLDRPERRMRSTAGIVALAGALAAAGATLLVPGVAGHAGQTSPRALSLGLDWAHLAAGSIWIGGLIGLSVVAATVSAPRRIAALVLCVPRFSNVALGSVLVLIGAGIGESLQHIPTLASLWQTSYGKALLVKIALLGLALLLAAVNLLRTVPRFKACAQRPELGTSAVQLLRRLVGAESVLIAGAILAAAVLSSLAPPSKALASVNKAAAHVGPGAVDRVVDRNGYRLAFRFSPNRAAVPNSFQVRIERGGQPVGKADVTVEFTMLDMEMGQQGYRFTETAPGVYTRMNTPALVMVGHWGLGFHIAPPGGKPFDVLLVDKAAG